MQISPFPFPSFQKTIFPAYATIQNIDQDFACKEDITVTAAIDQDFACKEDITVTIAIETLPVRKITVTIAIETLPERKITVTIAIETLPVRKITVTVAIETFMIPGYDNHSCLAEPDNQG